MSVGRTAVGTRAVAIAAGAVLTLLATYTVNADEPITPPQCSMRLSVEVTPDVPNPGNGAFISSLLGNHTDYQLFLQLQGPGPAERCQAVVDSMRNDGRVLSIDTS